MELRFYDKLILMTRRERGQWTSYPVTADALASQLARVPVTSGLLPFGALASGRLGGEPFVVVYEPARIATLATPQRSYTVPVPPLLVAGCGRQYRIFAVSVPTQPTESTLPLYVPPFPNAYDDGRICWGSVGQLPEAGRQIRQVLKLFLEESFFNAHVANEKSRKYPTSVIALWQELDAAQATEYPLDDLIPATVRLDWLLGGGPWS